MYYLAIDTCDWIYLGTKFSKVLPKLIGLVDQGKVTLIAPEIVIEEWNNRKQKKVIEQQISSINGRIKTAKGICEFLPMEVAELIQDGLNQFQQQQENIEQLALHTSQMIDDLFTHPTTIQLAILDDVKSQAVDLALAKKAPFQNKNSMADALIVLSFIEYVAQEDLSNSIFVSSNTNDFGSNNREVHDDLKELFEQNQVKYFSDIGYAVNEIENELIDEETLREISTTLRLDRFISTAAEAASLSVSPPTSLEEFIMFGAFDAVKHIFTATDIEIFEAGRIARLLDMQQTREDFASMLDAARFGVFSAETAAQILSNSMNNEDNIVDSDIAEEDEQDD